MNGYRKWLAFGTGLGIEIREDSLDVTVTRVRPSSVTVQGFASVPGYRRRPASEWGAELAKFLRESGAGHISATVLLPRSSVIVRQIDMPGVKDKDLASAVAFQLDGLHPFAEDEAVYGFARTSGGSVLVGIAQRDEVEKYAALFAEAGVKVAAFTFSAAAVYGALRVTESGPRTAEFVAVHQSAAGFELYGESASYPVFSAGLDAPNARAVELAIAELRLSPDTAPVLLGQLLPAPQAFPPSLDPQTPAFGEHALAYATAIAGACPWLSLPLNLLPEQYRRTNSRVRYIPTIILGTLLTFLLLALFVGQRIVDSRYAGMLESEVKKFEREARKAGQVDRQTAQVRARSADLDAFKRRSKEDLDALNELTRIVPPPGWVSSFELTRTGMRVSGETPAAAELLKILDNSPYFQGSEFVAGISRTANGEGFQLRSNREAPPAGAKPTTANLVPPPPAGPASETPAAQPVAAPETRPVTPATQPATQPATPSKRPKGPARWW